MKIWLLTQDQVNGYDTYDSAVVAAETEDQARRIYPSGSTCTVWSDDEKNWMDTYGGKNEKRSRNYADWATDIERITVAELGEANSELEAGVICASFNAG